MRINACLLLVLILRPFSVNGYPHHEPVRQEQNRGIGKATAPFTNSTITSSSFKQSNCTFGFSGRIRSTITTTVTVTAQEQGSHTPHLTSLPVSSTSAVVNSSAPTRQTLSATLYSNTPEIVVPGSSLSVESSSAFVPSPLPSTALSCSSEVFSNRDMQNLVGFNVVNQKPGDPNTPAPFKNAEDWSTAFALLKSHFRNINAVRMYSTTDSESGKVVTHLMNALPAAKANDLQIFVGVWSGGPKTTARFNQEKQALIDAVNTHGCSQIAAISVGNEDLYTINLLNISEEEKNNTKGETTDTLVDQIQQIRKSVRGLGCCMPVTHTDTSNEWTTTDKPWVSKLIQACDQAVVANIFPYWTNVSISEAQDSFIRQSSAASESVKGFDKELWLGETGWAVSQPNNQNQFGTDAITAQQYFQQIGCQILTSNGTAFYYVDWDEDAPSHGSPSFGLFNHEGKPVFNGMNCDKFKSDMALKAWDGHLPGYLGRSQHMR